MNETYFNATAERYDMDVPEIPFYILFLTTFIYICIFIMGSVGNGSTIAIVYGKNHIRSRMSYMFANLSVADLLVYFICLPSATVEMFAKNVWYFGEFLCKLIPFLENVVTITSVLTVLTIAIERCRGISDPIKYKYQCSKVRLPLLFFFIWCTAGLISFPLFLMTVYLDDTFLDGTPIKVCSIPVDAEWKRAYIVSYTIFFCLILLGLFVLVCIMHYKLKRHSKFLVRSSNNTVTSTTRGRRRVIVALFTSLLSSVVCVLPYRIFALWVAFAGHMDLERLGLEAYLNLISFARALTYLNGAVNPFIYAGMSSTFRSIMKSYFYKICFKVSSIFRSGFDTFGDNSAQQYEKYEFGEIKENTKNRKRDELEYNIKECSLKHLIQQEKYNTWH